MMMKKFFLKISEDYQLLEKAILKDNKIILPILSGVVFVSIFGRLDIIIIISSLIAFVDFNTFYIPDILNYFVIVYGLINFNLYYFILAIVLGIILYIYFKKEKIGFGDLKLIFGLTLIFGSRIFEIIIFSILTTFIFDRRKRIPLGFYLYWGVIIENIWFFNFYPVAFF
jgi:hypothetical protein